MTVHCLEIRMLTSKPSTMSPASLQNLSAKVVTREFELAKKLKLGESLKIVTQIPILKELESVCCYSQPINYQYQFAENIVGHSKEELFHINDNKYSTVIKALHYKNEEQYRSLETFSEQLIANCFPTVKLSTIKESKCTSLVTYPAPALIHIYYNVSPAYIIVQDLTQCGASKAMMIMNTLEDTMSKFDLGLKIVTRRSISKKRSKRALEKSQKSNKSVLWETKTHLMLPDNDAASTMSKVKDCRLYRTLVTYFKSSEQGTSSSGNHEIRSLDITCEVTSDQRTSSSAEHEIPSLDRIHAVTSADQGTSSSAEHDTSGQGTSSSAEHDIQSLDRRKHEMKLPFTAKTTKQVEEMECEIIQLKKTVRSLEDKFEESKRKLRAKEVIGVKSTETQTSKEQEEELQLKMNHLELTVKRLQDELRKSQEKTVEAEKSFKSMETYYKQQLLDVNKKNKDLNDKTNALKRKLQNKEEYIDVTLADLGSALVERDTLIKAMEAHGTARSSPVEVSSRSSQTSEMPFTPEAPTRSRGAAEVVTEPHEHLMVNSESSEENSRSNGAAIAVQESQAEANGGDRISLANIPTTTVERGLYFNYKLLLLLITRMLLSGDVIKFKEWASSILSVDVTASVNDVFLELDRRGAISAVDLEKLREFFEKILRIDLVYMVDCFMMGDYSYLRRLNNQGNTSRVIDASQRVMASSRTSLQSSAITSGKHRQSSHHSQPRTSEVEESYALPQSKRPDTSAVHSYRRTEVIGGTADAQGSKNATSNVSTANRPRSQVDMGNNGRKLSTFQRPDSARNHNSNAQAPNDDSDDDDDDSQWLCSHYKRLCYVKFDCCDKYWPCHRCHNNESKCGQKKLKSRDTKFLKCVSCGREEQFSSQSQFCTNCHKRFAKYFCAICKHLTGTDDNPYHCEKCAICRIHSDRSFHCDVCGVCLDVQLRGNHKCRAGSAHDECCICLEDAFTGCQILPCSHKVHKECATQMIRSGITRCPICRESFADKLERRNLPPPKKPPGK